MCDTAPKSANTAATARTGGSARPQTKSRDAAVPNEHEMICSTSNCTTTPPTACTTFDISGDASGSIFGRVRAEFVREGQVDFHKLWTVKFL